MEQNQAYVAQQNTMKQPPTAEDTYELVDVQTIKESVREGKCTGTVYGTSKIKNSPKVRLMLGVAVTTAVLALVVAVVAVILNPVLNSSQEIKTLTREIEQLQMNLSQTMNNIEENGHQLNFKLNSSQEIQSLTKEIEQLQMNLSQAKNTIEDNGYQLNLKLNQINSSQEIQSLELKVEMLQLNLSVEKLNNVIQGLLQNRTKGGINNPASSCSDLLSNSPSGQYWVLSSTNSPVQVYCDMTRTCCNTTGGWMRVANLDMTDPNQQCPYGFRLINRTTVPLRTCGRPGPRCVSTTFPVHGIKYSHVCGMIKGYQDRSPDSFRPYDNNRGRTIDDYYVDGVSITHGQSPRQHVWTFAAALDETFANHNTCPCTRLDLNYTGTVPPFIGQDYFCETGSRQHWQYVFYPEDPLWDGQGCGGTSTCCSFNNPPWFCKQLQQPTTDDIELRICGDSGITNEDTPLEIVEMYIK